jgi:hypothetical protein
MGLLDEAIREHLELKRRRGADPTEVERLEREALGPVRRLAQEPSLGASGEQSDAPYREAQPPAERLEDESGYGDDAELEAHHEYEGAEATYPDEGIAAHGVVPEPDGTHPDELAGQPQVSEEAGPETSEFDVEAEHAEEAAEGEDVLEETPEFLQDAPEHDRLWFEQRPPRDFDFDG